MSGGTSSLNDRRDPIDSALLDQESLDPGMHYRFFHMSPERIASARSKGYKTVKKDRDKVKTLFEQEDDDATGTIIHGDRILMMIPKEKYEARKRRQAQISRQRLEGPAARFRQKAAQAGVEVAEGAKKGGHEPPDEGE